MSHWQRVNLHANPPTRRKWSIVNLVVDQQSTIDSRYNLDILPKKSILKMDHQILATCWLQDLLVHFVFSKLTTLIDWLAVTK